MKHHAPASVIFPVALALSLACAASDTFAISHKFISLGDVKPAGFSLNSSWEAIGIDPSGNVYSGFNGTLGGKQDCAIFRYNTVTGEKKCLGTLRLVAQRENNLGSGEEIPKGHAHFPYMNGYMYIGSQGFHDISSFSQLSSYRGSHIFAVNVTTGEITDCTRGLPDGVVQKQQGIVDLVAMPERGLLIGLSHPRGDIVMFNPATKTLKIEPGVAGSDISIGRDIAVTPDGKVFWEAGYASGKVYCYNMNTGEKKTLGANAGEGFWNGRTQTCDRSTIYISNYSKLFRVDAAATRLVELATFPVVKVWGLNLSRDGKKIFWIPVKNGNLYEYDIATGSTSSVYSLGSLTANNNVSGGDVRDSRGRIYCNVHSYGGGTEGIIQIDVSDRTGPGQMCGDTQTPSRSRSPAAAAHSSLRLARHTKGLVVSGRGNPASAQVFDIRGRAFRAGRPRRAPGSLSVTAR